MGLMPLVSAVPSVAQTARTGGYSEMKDTTANKMTPMQRPLCAAVALMQAAVQAKENVVAKDTVIVVTPALNPVRVTQISKPTAVKVGDVIAQMEVEYFAEMAGRFTTGWKVTKIDAAGIEVTPTINMEMFMSEHASANSLPPCRIGYGKADTVGPISNPAYGPVMSMVMSIRIDAKRGNGEGTVILTAVGVPPVRYATKTVKARVGTDFYPLGQITKIDSKGVEFSNGGNVASVSEAVMGIAKLYTAVMTGTVSDELNRVHPWRLDYGQTRRLGEYAISTSITVEKGSAPGTAVVKITQAER